MFYVYVYVWEKEGLVFPFALLQSHVCFWIKREGLVWSFYLENCQITASHCFVRSSIVFMKVIGAANLRYSAKLYSHILMVQLSQSECHSSFSSLIVFLNFFFIYLANEIFI